jgi:hypothetical protein
MISIIIIKYINIYTIEKFYIYRGTKLNNQINDKLTVKPNVVFETLVR